MPVPAHDIFVCFCLSRSRHRSEFFYFDGSYRLLVTVDQADGEPITFCQWRLCYIGKIGGDRLWSRAVAHGVQVDAQSADRKQAANRSKAKY